MRHRLPPPPLDIPWLCKPVSSARSGLEVMPDGRLRCWIEHECLRGVTPAMLRWWFGHLEGDMDWQGQRLSRYRVWHPRDHIRVRYAKRGAEGRVGVGSVIHLTEMLGANPRYLVDVHSEIRRLDEGGFSHRPRVHGLRLAAMDYFFEPVADGTLYRNSLTVGVPGALAAPLNALLRRFVFDEARGHAWIRHNIEEVGNFEAFLPDLYAAEAGTEKMMNDAASA